MALSLRSYCNGKATMHSETIVDLHVTANYLKIMSCTKFYLGEIILPASIKRT